jgi:hypothetical protein
MVEPRWDTGPSSVVHLGSAFAGPAAGLGWPGMARLFFLDFRAFGASPGGSAGCGCGFSKIMTLFSLRVGSRKQAF